MKDETPITAEDVIKAIDDFDNRWHEKVNINPNVIIPYYTLDHLSAKLVKAKAELEKKDKIIDLLIDALMENYEHFNYCDRKSHDKHLGNCKNCIKEYFTNKVEKE